MRANRQILCVFICNFYVYMLGCTHALPSSNTSSEINNLATEIESLSAEVYSYDARQTSEILINTSVDLANEYQMVSPPRYHNFLINIGLRERGLCCHWAEDLFTELRHLEINSIKFDWLVTNLGNPLREHNALVVYAEDKTWHEGIIFDPWRKSGIPFWTKVSNDKYPWHQHPLSGQWEVLRCK